MEEKQAPPVLAFDELEPSMVPYDMAECVALRLSDRKEEEEADSSSPDSVVS